MVRLLIQFSDHKNEQLNDEIPFWLVACILSARLFLLPEMDFGSAHRRQHHSFAKCVSLDEQFAQVCDCVRRAANGNRNGRNFSEAIKNEENTARTI